MRHNKQLFLLSVFLFAGLAPWGASFAYGQTSSASTIAPDLSISVNHTPEPQVQLGEPLIITILLSNPGIFSANVTALQINPQSGSWANTVKLSITDGSGA